PPRALSARLIGPRPRILVLSPGPPLLAPAFDGLARARRALRLRRVPQPPAREPLQNDVLVRALELAERRQEIRGVARPERRGRVVDENRPVREARRHTGVECKPARAPDIDEPRAPRRNTSGIVHGAIVVAR